MKVCAPILFSALGVSVVCADPSSLRRRLADVVVYPSGLKNTTATTGDTYHMKTVRVVQARVQGDKPLWDATYNAFLSMYGSTPDLRHRGVLDTANTASVEGALMYVQAETINEGTRGASDRCNRKNGVKYVVFYDFVITQTNETLAEYGGEYGKYLAMDGGQCTPTSGEGDAAVFPEECHYFSGTNGHKNLGPSVGGGDVSTDERAPYPNTWWFSYPNTCALKKRADKTDTCRAATRGGLCAFDTKPDGVTCTFNYRILGWVPIDDLVGITSLKSASDVAYTNFTEFCKDGGVEFNGTANNTMLKGLPFWENPRDATANAARATKLVTMYNDAVAGTVTLKQVSAEDKTHFKALPTIASLRTENPHCYENVKECAEAMHGCKRDLYGQLCVKCESMAEGCVMKPNGFVFPTLVKATPPPATLAPTLAPGSTTPAPGTPGATTPGATTPAPTKSGASAVSMLSMATVAAACALSYLL